MKHFDTPMTHVIIEDFFDDANRAMQECLDLEKEYEAGLYLVRGVQTLVNKIKTNIIVKLDQMYQDRTKSYILTSIPEILWTEENKEKFKGFGPMYKMWMNTTIDETQLSAYGDKDHYDFHVDVVHNSPLTLIIFLFKEPKVFEGGNIMLKGDDGFIKTIEIKNNMGLIFPSLTLHGVTEIKTDSEKLEDKRISVQYWAGYK